MKSLLKIKILFSLLLLLLCNSYTHSQQEDLFHIKGKIYSAIDTTYIIKWAFVVPNAEREYENEINSSLFYVDSLKPGLNKLRVNIPFLGTYDTLLNLENNIEELKIYVKHAPCQFNAEEDIKNGKPKLLLVGGIATTIYRFQEFFEKKYEIEYYDFGCVPDAYDCIKLYNEKVFKFLDEKYGKKWRDSVRPDVEFLNKKR